MTVGIGCVVLTARKQDTPPMVFIAVKSHSRCRDVLAQPQHVMRLNMTGIFPVQYPRTKRDMTIWRRPSSLPKVQNHATGATDRRLKKTIVSAPSRRPMP